MLFDFFRLICPSFKIYIIQKWKSQGFILKIPIQPRCFFEKPTEIGSFFAGIYDLGSQLLQILQSRLPPKCGAALSLCYENMQLDLRKTLRDQKIKDWRHGDLGDLDGVESLL